MSGDIPKLERREDPTDSECLASFLFSLASEVVSGLLDLEEGDLLSLSMALCCVFMLGLLCICWLVVVFDLMSVFTFSFDTG